MEGHAPFCEGEPYRRVGLDVGELSDDIFTHHRRNLGGFVLVLPGIVHDTGGVCITQDPLESQCVIRACLLRAVRAPASASTAAPICSPRRCRTAPARPALPGRQAVCRANRDSSGIQASVSRFHDIAACAETGREKQARIAHLQLQALPDLLPGRFCFAFGVHRNGCVE